MTFDVVKEGSTRVSGIQSGDYQFIWPVPTESYQTLESDSNVNVFSDEGIVVYYLCMNTQKAPFNDIRVRQAMNYAIDKDAYIEIIRNGLGTKATSILGPAVAGYKKNEPIEADLDKAKELLKEAGYEVSGGINAPYIWLRTPDGLTSWEFFDRLLTEANVVGTPGSGFGPGGEHYFRLSAFGSHENTKEAVKRIKKM